jgi:NAD(P)-dependent dehydrogenase (short-subunit alcohol dehydrogenase family)
MNGLADKCIIVTGAASGIGWACVSRLIDEGARVMGADIVAPPGSPAGWAVEQGATSPWDFRLVDVADQASVVELIDSASRFGGRIDGVVNAAGVAGGGPVHMLPIEEWDRVLQVNLTGTYLVAKHAIDAMLAQPAVG